jgi:hypothetical protein
MPKFAVGDRVERVGPLISYFMRNGIIIRVVPNKDDRFTEYEVDFGDRIMVIYQTELRLLTAVEDSGN